MISKDRSSFPAFRIGYRLYFSIKFFKIAPNSIRRRRSLHLFLSANYPLLPPSLPDSSIFPRSGGGTLAGSRPWSLTLRLPPSSRRSSPSSNCCEGDRSPQFFVILYFVWVLPYTNPGAPWKRSRIMPCAPCPPPAAPLNLTSSPLPFSSSPVFIPLPRGTPPCAPLCSLLSVPTVRVVLIPRLAGLHGSHFARAIPPLPHGP